MGNSSGDVRELRDASGAAFAHYAYDAYGRPLETATRATSLVSADAAARIAEANVLRYAGYCYDSASGLFYCSQRYYDPQTMCFVSKDPARADGEESAYQYCGGDPVGKVDPSGLEKVVAHASKPVHNQGRRPNCYVSAIMTLRRWVKDKRWTDDLVDKETEYWYGKGGWTWGEAGAHSLWPGARCAWYHHGRSYWQKAFKDRYGITMAHAPKTYAGWLTVTSEMHQGRPILVGATGGAGHAFLISGFHRAQGIKEVQVATWGKREWVDYDKLVGSGAAIPGNSTKFKWRYSAYGLK